MTTNEKIAVSFIFACIIILIIMKLYKSHKNRENYYDDASNNLNAKTDVNDIVKFTSVSNDCGSTSNNNENPVSDAARCKGGPYMWQGDSNDAKKCRAMMQTPEGRYDISKYNCSVGYNGRPAARLEYTSQSNGSFKNTQCNCDKKVHGMSDSLCSN